MPWADQLKVRPLAAHYLFMSPKSSTSLLALGCIGLLACASNPVTADSWTPPAPGSAPAGSPIATHGQLRVTGTQVQDASGAPYQLKGISSMWLNYETRGYALSKGGLQSLRDDWKASVVRAAMGTDQPSGYLTTESARQNMLNKVRMIVQNAIDLGVYVIIDWHTERAVDQQAEAIEFFTEMATKYGEYPNVIYEPYNEPARSAAGTAYTWANIKPYHEAVVAAIRAVDPDNLIVLGTPQWSQLVDAASADQVAGTNLLYTLHWYSCSHQQWLRDKADTALAAGAALFITEFGATYADGGIASSTHANGDPGNVVCRTEAEAWFTWMATNNISGVAWKLDACSDASCLLAGSASTSGPWTIDKVSTDNGKTGPSGNAGGHGALIFDWVSR